jgi:prepilin-type N-terminal cleavage/methylation domain-containing protein
MRCSGRRAGFTLIEMMVSLTIFTAVIYSLAVAIDVGNSSQVQVSRTASSGRALRGSTGALFDELRASSDAQIAVTTLAGGNHNVRFRMPIQVGGAAAWGVYEPTLGPTAADQNQADWFVQYTVRTTVDANGTVQRQLVRQLLDAGLAVRRERVLAQGLRDGAAVPPGFRMAQVGDLWELTLSTDDRDGRPVIREVFHVHARN